MAKTKIQISAETYRNYCLNGYNGKFKDCLFRAFDCATEDELKRLHSIFSLDVDQYCIYKNIDLFK